MQYTDIFELSRSRRVVEGKIELEKMPELLEVLDCPQEEGAVVTFRAEGTDGHKNLPGANLQVSAKLRMNCVRCGEPCEVEIDEEVPFLFTKTEEQADEMPLDEDDGYEIVVGSTKFNLIDWVQEEVLLSLPAFPQHDDCEPDRSALQTEETEETLAKPNPFAVLAGLKTGK